MSAVHPDLAVAVHTEALDLLADRPNSDQAALVEALVARRDPLLAAGARAEAVAAVMARITGLGPLQPLLADSDVTEVMVNGPGCVWVERSGHLEPTDVWLDGDEVARLVALASRGADDPAVEGQASGPEADDDAVDEAAPVEDPATVD